LSRPFYYLDPTTGLCSVHWATPELPSSIQLKWSLALTQNRLVFASNTLTMSPTSGDTVPWACIIVGSTLNVLTRSGVLGSVDLSTSCPAVVGAVVLDTVHSHSITNAYVEGRTFITTATILLSCAGDRYFALTLQINATSCHAVSICERFFLLPSEATFTTRSTKAVRQTRTMLPGCETMMRVPSSWLQGNNNNNHNNDIVILLGFHPRFGVQLVIEGQYYLE